MSPFAGNRVAARKKRYMAQRMRRLRIRLGPREGIWKSASNQLAPGAAAVASRQMIRSNWSRRKQSRKKFVAMRSKALAVGDQFKTSAWMNSTRVVSVL